MEPLSKSALERLEVYERELRESLRGLAPVERDEAIRELRAHVLEAAEAGRQAGKSDDEVVEHVLKGFGNPSDYATEYISLPRSESPKLGVLDKVILFSVKGAAKLWVAFILGLVYFTIFVFAYSMSTMGILGGVASIIYYYNLLPQYLSPSFDIDIPALMGFLLIPMGIAGLYLSTRLLIKVLRFHYYYRSSPRKLFTYLKESRGARLWTFWRTIDVAAVLTIVVAFTIGVSTQSIMAQPGKARRVEPVTKESRVQSLSTEEADIRLKLLGDINLNKETATASVSPAELAKFISIYNYDELRPVVEVERRGARTNIRYVPRGFGKRPGTGISFPGSFPDMQANSLKENKHRVFLSPAVTWDLKLESIDGNTDLNLEGLKIKYLRLNMLAGGRRVIRFGKSDNGQEMREDFDSGQGSIRSASVEVIKCDLLDIDFKGLANKRPPRIQARAVSSPLILRDVGDADPAELDVDCISSDATIHLKGNWSRGMKRITLKTLRGNLVVNIPKDLPARVSIDNLAGRTELFGIRSEGSVDYKTPGFDTAEKRLDIRIESRAGDIGINYSK